MSFADAVSVFGNPLARIFPDEEHSAEELREIIVGHSSAKPLLPVCFMEAQVEKVRVISARRAIGREQCDYKEHVTDQAQSETSQRAARGVPFRLHEGQAESIRSTDAAGIRWDTAGPGRGACVQERGIRERGSTCASGNDAHPPGADEQVAHMTGVSREGPPPQRMEVGPSPALPSPTLQ